MKYARQINFVEPVEIVFPVEMDERAFRRWYWLRLLGARKALRGLASHEKPGLPDIDQDLLMSDELPMSIVTMPYSKGEKTNVTAICEDPQVGPLFEDVLMMVFEEFELARSALCDAVSDPEYRRILPRLAQMCGVKSADIGRDSPAASNGLAGLVRAQAVPNASSPNDLQKSTSGNERKQTVLQRKRPGRPPDPENDEAFQIILEGGFSEEAEQAAFDYWCQAKGIEEPNGHDRKAYKKAKTRAEKRYHKKGAEMGHN